MKTVSEQVSSVIVFAGTFILAFAFWKLLRPKQSNRIYPPSLPSLPFLGSLPFLPDMDKLHIFLTDKAKNLGSIFTVDITDTFTVVINGRSTIYDAFVKQSLNFAGRPILFAQHYINPISKGIIFRPFDSEFKKYHLLSLSILKKFGFGQKIMENRIQMEVEDLLGQMKKLKGEAFNPKDLITLSVSNVIVSIIMGKRFEHSSSKLKTMVKRLHELIELSLDLSILNLFPKLRFFPTYHRRLHHAIQVKEDVFKFLNEKIDAGVKGDLEENFISHFLDSEGQNFDRDQLLCTLYDFFVAGTETTATTLLWSLVLLANYPEIQRKLQADIDSVIAKDRLPSLNDKKNLPFIEAFILELMRYKTLVPLGVPRETLQDTILNGYFIPKGSTVIANIYSVHMDVSDWKEPNLFNPERFLDTDGKVIRRDSIIPFSVGRRSCLGEVLAEQEIFLFIAGFLQHFNILPPEGEDSIICGERVTPILLPSPFEVRLQARLP